MSKNTLAISCPVDTYSGYGARARDFIKALIALDKFDIQILSQRWGNTRFGFLEDHGEYELASLIVPHLTTQPDVWIQHTVPNEFQPVGKFNIGLTAGIETTICDPSWLVGCNRMDLIIGSSAHSLLALENSIFEQKDSNTKQVVQVVKLEKPTATIFEGVDLTKYRELKMDESGFDLSSVKENFLYLVVGHWMQGDLGEDRKNIGYTIKSFLETFKNRPNSPALLLKVQKGGSSIQDQETILNKIEQIKGTVNGKLPNVYLLHGDLSDEEMNKLYNNPKVKAMVSFTKGEGFGRPLLEFSIATGKPIIASGWSGHRDFLDEKYAVLVGGTLTNVHPSAAMPNMLLKEAQWFTPDDNQVGTVYKQVVKKYKDYIKSSQILGRQNRKKFSLQEMKEEIGILLDEKLPEFPKQIELKLPSLQLPKLEKLD